jgi:2-dehydropantoate 2-reductase
MRRMAIAGAGAVGSLIGGYLSQGGEDVTLIGPSWLEHIQAIRQHGLIIDGCRGKHLVSVKALHASELDQLEKRSLDILFLAVKSNDTERVLNLMLPYLRDDAWVVSCQNGINTDVISNIVGSWRTIGCVLRFDVALWEPGHVTQTGGSKVTFTIGELNGEVTPRIQEISRILDLCAKSRITTNIIGELWAKLVLNCMVNPISGITGYTVGRLYQDEQVRHIYRVIAAEGIRVAKALGCKVEPILGLSADLWEHSGEDHVEEIEEVIINHGRAGGTESYPSMLQDIIKGRPTEIGWLNGYVIRRGKEAGIPTPANEVILSLVKEIEDGKLKYSPANISTAYRLIMAGR